MIVITLLGAACGPDECPEVGLFEDARLPQLCPADSLTLTPSKARLYSGRHLSETNPAAATDAIAPTAEMLAGAAPGEPVEAAAVLVMSVLGADEDFHPREAAHVDVSLNNTDFATLQPHEGSNCRKLDDAHLHCQLDVEGVVLFELKHAEKTGGTTKVTVTSGGIKQEATIDVLEDDDFELSLTSTTDLLSPFSNIDGPLAIQCADSEQDVLSEQASTSRCWSQKRQVELRRELFSNMDGTSELALAGSDFTVSARVELVFLEGGEDHAYLSATPCYVEGERRTFIVEPLGPLQSSWPPLYLCIGMRAVDVMVRGWLEGESAMADTLRVTAEAAPAAVVAVGEDASTPVAGDDGCFETDAELFDCLANRLRNPMLLVRICDDAEASRAIVTHAEGQTRAECEVSP